MFFRGKIVELGNLPVRQAFYNFHYAPVQYEDLDRKQSAGPPPAPSPFLKHITTFSEQQEIRIVFQPAKPILQSVLTIKIPRPEVLIEEVFRGLG